MRINSKYISVLGGLALSLAGCTSEDLNAPTNGGQTPQTVNLTLTVSRPSDNTRTIIEESDDKYSLASKWSEGDQLLVVDKQGQSIGYLDLKDGVGEYEGVFNGTIDGVVNGGEYRVWYLGGSNTSDNEIDIDVAYTSLQDDGTLKLELGDREETTNEVVISGKFADLNRADLLTKSVTLLVKGTEAGTSENITLEAQLAMARFHISGLSEGIVTDTDAKITLKSLDAETKKNVLPYGVQTISASEDLLSTTSSVSNLLSKDAYGYSISNKILEDCKETTVNLATGVNKSVYSLDLYLPLVPGTYKLAFEIVSNGKSYQYSFGNDTELKKGMYYSFAGDLDDAPEVSPGINVTVEEDDLVGGVFEINGKKFRFTRGNLKYNTQTGAWSLMDYQYDFICKGGWTLSNGTWYTKGTYQQVEPEIDLYGFGTTGLYDIESDETAQAPTFWHQTETQTYSTAASYYPTNNTTANQGSGFIGSYLEHGTQFTNFDWGKAYYLYKKGEPYPTADKPYTTYDWEIDPTHKEGDPEALRYFTLSSNDWSNLQSKYFMCGVTITGITNPVNTAAKNNIYGCMIFPITGEGPNSAEINKDKLAKVKALLTGRVTYLGTKLTTNLNFTGTNYQYFDYSWVKMTVAQFKELEKLGVVFLPEAGHKATDSYTKTDAFYWTSSAGQQYTSIIFKFDGDSSPHVFKLDGQSNRSLGCAVRLVKEVPADYKDPMVVE